MTWTIYTLGDLSLFQSVLNAVAMIFSANAGLFTTTSGLGLGPVIAVSLLIALVVVMASTMVAQATGGGAKNNLASLLMLVVVMTLVVTPKQTVVLEDIYSGKVAVVDNVPLGVAAPAGFISAFTRGISRKFETAFSTTSGNYITMGEQGFINPINLLASLRAASLVADENLTRSFMNLYRDCAMWRVDVDTLKTSANPLEYVLGGARAGGGFTTYYRTARPASVGVDARQAVLGAPYSCVAAADAVSGDFNDIFEPAGKKAARFAAMSGVRLPDSPAGSSAGPGAPPVAYSGTSSGREPTNVEVIDATKLLPLALGSGGLANQNAANLFVAPLIQTAAKCANASVDTRTYQQCAGMMMEDAARIFTAQSAGEAAMFTKMVVPTMNLLLAMFFAFAPIVVMAAATSSGYGTSMLVKYFFFGIWTQSWMPMAAIINYLIQVDVANDIQTIVSTYGVVNMANAPDIFNTLQRKMAVGFNLLAATPLITMAVLSGSFYAMTSLAQRMSSGGMGQGVGDVSAIERRSFQGAPLVSAQSEVSGTSTTAMLTAGGAQSQATWDATTTLQNARSNAIQSLTQFAKEGGGSRAAERVSGWSETQAQQASSAIKRYLDNGSTQEARDAWNGLVQWNKSQGMTDEHARAAAAKQAFQTTFSGQAGFGFGGPGAGINAGAGAANSATSEGSVAHRNTDGKSEQASLNIGRNMASSVANALRTGIGTEQGRSMTNSIAEKLDTSDKESFTAATKAIETHSTTLANTNALTDGAGSKVSVPMATLATKMANDNGAVNAVKGMGTEFAQQMQMATLSYLRDTNGNVPLAEKMAALSVLQQNAGVPGALTEISRINAQYLGMHSTPSQGVTQLDQTAHAQGMAQVPGIIARADNQASQSSPSQGSAAPAGAPSGPPLPSLKLTRAEARDIQFAGVPTATPFTDGQTQSLESAYKREAAKVSRGQSVGPMDHAAMKEAGKSVDSAVPAQAAVNQVAEFVNNLFDKKQEGGDAPGNFVQTQNSGP